MPFFQNPFTSDFEGYWSLADRQASLTFRCPHNAGRGPESVTAWAQGPYNLTGNDADGNSKDVLSLSFSLAGDYKSWTDLLFTITGATASAITPTEVVGALNNNAVFSDWFTASRQTFRKNAPNERVVITQNQPQTKMRFYVKTGGAESVIHFNKLAGVAALPSYFARHTLANRYQFPDSQNALIQLNTTGEDALVIDHAVDHKGNSLGYSASSVQADYQLLQGRSGIFTFQNLTVDGDGSNRILQIIEYPAGSVAGNLGRKINYVYTGANTKPSAITEVPYTLLSGDLITPP